jgi:hypothetical protein
MVERSRRTKVMNEITKARMLLTTAALAAVAAFFAGGANARLMDVDGGTAAGAAPVPSSQPQAIPYLSHGIGVDESQFNGTAQPNLTGVHAALERDRSETSVPLTIPYLSHGIGVDASQFGGTGMSNVSTDNAPLTIPYLSHGIGVDASQFGGQTTSIGLTGDSPLTRVSTPESVGLTGDSAATRYPRTVGTTATSGDKDVDWTSFGAGAGLAALLAAAVAGIVLTTRRRGGVALP